jgi:hypothetical protein
VDVRDHLGLITTRCILPLVAGAALYCIRPPSNLLACVWLADLGLPQVFSFARGLNGQGRLPLPMAVVMNGPGFLWAFAATSWVVHVWHANRGREATLWVATTAILVVLAEFAQEWGWLAGTFDPLDVLFNALGAIVAARMPMVGVRHVASEAAERSGNPGGRRAVGRDLSRRDPEGVDRPDSDRDGCQERRLVRVE